MTNGYQLVVDLCPDAFTTDGGMHSKCKIQRRSADGQHLYIALGRVHINFFCQERGFKILQKIDGIGILAAKCFPYLVKPFVKAAFICRSFFVFPMRCQPFLRDFVHPFCTDLHLNPFTLWPHHRCMERFIPVTFRVAQPVTQAFRRRIIFICNDAIHLPAIAFFFLIGGVNNDTDGKKIVHFFKAYALFFHLIPDAVDTFWASVNFEHEIGPIQFVL